MNNSDATITPPKVEGVTLQDWIKDKLDTVPSRYSEYDEESYAMGETPGDTGAKIRSHWRHNSHQQTPEKSNVYQISSTTQEQLSNPQLSAGTSSAAGATVNHETENSKFNQQVDAELLQDRDSTYWGDLATPAWPQSPSKAKVVYIQPRSRKPVTESGNEALSNGLRFTADKEGLRSYTKNGPSPLRASVDTLNNEGSSFENNFAFMVPHGESENITTTTNYEAKPASAGFKEIKTSSSDISSLRAKQPGGKGYPLGPFLPGGLQNPHTHNSPDNINIASDCENFSPESRSHLSSVSEKLPKIYYSRLPDIPVDTADYRDFKSLKIQGGDQAPPKLPEFETTYKSLEDGKREVETYSRSRFDTRCAEDNLPIIREAQGEYDALVESFMASSNKYSPNTSSDQLHYLPTLQSSRAPSYMYSTRAASPSSVYSANSDNPHNDPDMSDVQFRQIFSTVNSDYDPGSPYDSMAHTYQPEGNNIKHKQFKDFNGRKGLQVTRKSTPAGQSYTGGNPKVKLGSEIGEDPTNQGATIKLPSPTHSTSFMVTKELIQEEEMDVLGKFGRPTFAAHIPRFGKDSTDEIQKAHAKGDSKPAFLKSIRGAVNESINMTWKSPTKSDPNTSRFPTRFRRRPIEKMVISAPMHNGNPLLFAGSASTPNILLTARPIPGTPRIYTGPFQVSGEISDSTLQEQRAKEDIQDSKPLPWELNDAPAEENVKSDKSKDADLVRVYDSESSVRKAMLDPLTPTISIGPFQQASLYSWIECSVVQACSDFLKHHQLSLNINLLKKEVKKWSRNEVKLLDGVVKKRDKPVEFMFGMEIQCRLLEGNYKVLVFSGPHKMNPLPTLTTWKQMIPSFSPRNFCKPDYLILEHLRVVERVLYLIGEGYWDKTLFEKKRSEAVGRMLGRKERTVEEKITELQKERVNAETELLMEVGILSTEDI